MHEGSEHHCAVNTPASDHDISPQIQTALYGNRTAASTESDKKYSQDKVRTVRTDICLTSQTHGVNIMS